MDSLEKWGQQLSQVTMYDIKSYYNQAKNAVLNLSEMEVKVRDATNDEPWGASSTLMNEIAQGTFHFQTFNEIMPAIYSRFMEKEARQWRQIYKALQLLEFLIKNGSERTVDDARSHVGTIKMLRNFHYIDEKGKDQGINVRNRAKEIVELLADLDKVRSERRKAKANRTKYVGTGNDAMSFTSGGGRYGGFGNESGVYDQEYGSSSNYSMGGGGSYGGGGSGSGSGFRDEGGRKFAEYDAGDDEDVSVRRTSTSGSGRLGARQGSISHRSNASTTSAAAPPPPKAKVPEVDLLGGLDDEPVLAPAKAEKALPATGEVDEFGDFEGATASPTAMAPQQSKPIIPQQTLHSRQLSGAMAGLNLGGSGSSGGIGTMQSGSGMGMGMGMMARPTTFTPQRPPQQQQQSFTTPMQSPPLSGGMGMGGGGGMLTPMGLNSTQSQQRPQASAQSSVFPKPAVPGGGASLSKPSAGGGFDDLWSMSLGSSSSTTTTKAAPGGLGGKSIQELEKEKAQASIWGGVGGGGGASKVGGGSGGFGNFGGSGAGASSSAGGDDNLLL